MPTIPTQEHRHPDHLLPWYVNQTLSSSEQIEVEKHLHQCPRCQAELSLFELMRQAVKETPTQSPREFGLNRLLNEVQAEKEMAQTRRKSQSGSWWKGLTIAASLMILLQAGLLIDTWFLSKSLVPLNGPQEHGVVLQVSFAPNVTEAQMRESISAIHGTFIDGPSQLGIYHIRLNRSPQDENDTKETIKLLRQQKEVFLHAAINY